MRKLIMQEMVSIDGYFEGPNRELDWHVVDSEFNEFAIEFLGTLDTLVFGRVTYQLMADYWPSLAAATDDPVVAGFMNNLQKVVFSKTLDKLGWQNSKLAKSDPLTEIAKLKQQPGKNIAIFGSSVLASTLIDHNLIDEYRIMVNPVALGSGVPLFNGIKNKLKLKLIDSKVFNSGNALLIYIPELP